MHVDGITPAFIALETMAGCSIQYELCNEIAQWNATTAWVHMLENPVILCAHAAMHKGSRIWLKHTQTIWEYDSGYHMDNNV